MFAAVVDFLWARESSDTTQVFNQNNIFLKTVLIETVILTESSTLSQHLSQLNGDDHNQTKDRTVNSSSEKENSLCTFWRDVVLWNINT